MEFQQLLMARESCRTYADRPVARELLEKLVEAAHFSPSGCNAQPWRFIVVDEPEAKTRLIGALDDEGLNGCPWGKSVPAFIVICEEQAKLMPGVAERYGSQRFAQMDIGMAAMTLCYEAAALGLGACMVGTFHEQKLHEALGIPPERPVRLIITVGYDAAGKPPRAKVRKEMHEICSYNHW